MATLKEILEKNIGEFDSDGISKKCLNSNVDGYIIIRHDEVRFLIQVRFEGWDNPLTHPDLRQPSTKGWIKYEFENDGDEWYWFA